MPQATKAQQTSSEETGIVQHLNAAITWYRQLTSANESAGQPSGDYGLALAVRYPVVFYRESEIDDQMAKKVVEVIDSLPELKATVGAPTIRTAN